MIGTKASESSEQIKFVAWFRSEYPDIIIFAIPNGGKRDRRVAVKLKQEGVLPGVLDLFIPALRLFIEFKFGSNRLTASQNKFMEAVSQHGYESEVVYSSLEAEGLIKNIFQDRLGRN